MHTSGEPVSTIAATLGVSRATVYRVLAKQDDNEATVETAGQRSTRPKTTSRQGK
jgi:transposase